MSRATELTEGLEAVGRRPAGSDAERRAAGWAAAALRSDPRRRVEVQTFWSRPNWALAQAWHLGLGVAGSLVATTQAKVGAALIFLALVCLILDWTLLWSPGRWLTREHASQNVVSASPRTPEVRLVLTAYLDTSRRGAHRAILGCGVLFWSAAALVLALVAALLRVEGHPHSTLVTVLQLIATLAILLAGGWLWLGGAEEDDAAGVAGVLALTRLLDAAPPAHLGVDVVLAGAGCGDGLGLRRHLRRRRRSGQNATNAIVLGLGSGEGTYLLASDGPLLPMGFFGALRDLAEAAGFTPTRARGCSAALPGRLARLPSLTVGGEPEALVSACLDLVDGIDLYVGALRRA